MKSSKRDTFLIGHARRMQQYRKSERETILSYMRSVEKLI